MMTTSNAPNESLQPASNRLPHQIAESRSGSMANDEAGRPTNAPFELTIELDFDEGSHEEGPACD